MVANRDTLWRWLLLTAGTAAVVVGTIGIVVPLLPTTPFLLLAAACFIRSSERLYAWLIRHPWFGSYIRNYREHRGMTRRAKVIALGLLWGVIGYSAVMVAASWWLRLLLVLVAVGVTLHLWYLRTLAPDLPGPEPPGDTGAVVTGNLCERHSPPPPNRFFDHSKPLPTGGYLQQVDGTAPDPVHGRAVAADCRGSPTGAVRSGGP